MSNKITMGSDPEFFVVPNGGRQAVSAHEVVEGTKDRPQPLKCEGSAIQRDGTALEINTKPVVLYDTSDNELNLRNVGWAFQQSVHTPMQEVISNFLTPKNLTFSKKDYVKFSKTALSNIPAIFLELGCEPDFNAWTMEQNEVDEDVASTGVRVAGGHLHFGWSSNLDVSDPTHLNVCSRIVKQLDYALGLYETMKSKGTARKKLYGQAGAFRPKSYGVEYRTLSNFWLFNGYTDKVAKIAASALWRLGKGERFDAKHGDIQEIINEADAKRAREIWMSLQLPSM